jgi:hypothetical protein
MSRSSTFPALFLFDFLKSSASQTRWLDRQSKTFWLPVVSGSGVLSCSFFPSCCALLQGPLVFKTQFLESIFFHTHAQQRFSGANRDISLDLRKAMAYIKFLEWALASLPEEFHYSGRCCSLYVRILARQFRGICIVCMFASEYVCIRTCFGFLAFLLSDRVCGIEGERT